MLLRIVTALILAPVFILLTLYLPTPWFSGFLLVVMLIGLYEWNKLTVDQLGWYIPWALALGLVTWLGLSFPGILLGFCLLAAAFWVCMLFALMANKTLDSESAKKEFLTGVFILVSTWSALMLLHMQGDDGPVKVVAAMFIVWAADSFAYFFGRWFGKRKLAPTISPNKTIEGLLGGLLGAVLVTTVFGTLVFSLSMEGTTFWLWFTAGVCAAMASVVGDLYQSRLKRAVGVKDSGVLLPGHGGILDRIDGVLAAMPIFISIWYWS